VNKVLMPKDQPLSFIGLTNLFRVFPKLCLQRRDTSARILALLANVDDGGDDKRGALPHTTCQLCHSICSPVPSVLFGVESRDVEVAILHESANQRCITNE
jgi:hypothetical protein